MTHRIKADGGCFGGTAFRQAHIKFLMDGDTGGMDVRARRARGMWNKYRFHEKPISPLACGIMRIPNVATAASQRLLFRSTWVMRIEKQQGTATRVRCSVMIRQIPILMSSRDAARRLIMTLDDPVASILGSRGSSWRAALSGKSLHL